MKNDRLLLGSGHRKKPLLSKPKFKVDVSIQPHFFRKRSNELKFRFPKSKQNPNNCRKRSQCHGIDGYMRNGEGDRDGKL